MKVNCNRGALLDALAVTGAAVPSRSPKPELSCLKLVAEEDHLTIAATDTELAIRYRDNQVEVAEPGETLVSADKLRDIVRESIDDKVSLETIGEQCHIRGSNALFKIYTQNPASFPPVSELEGEATFEIPGGQLKQLIGKTIFAAAREGTRYAFNGVLTTQRDGKLLMVASDGHRLAQAVGPVASGKGGSGKDAPRAIVPTKALSLVDKLVDDPEELVKVQMRENQIVFQTASATLSSILVEGQFPPFEDVIPKNSDKKMTAACGDFASAVRQASLLTTEESKGVRMHFSGEGLRLSSRSPDAGEAEVNFACKYDGEPVEIGFNPRYVLDALKVVDADEITLELSAPNRPGLLRGGEDFIYVIMPVNLQ